MGLSSRETYPAIYLTINGVLNDCQMSNLRLFDLFDLSQSTGSIYDLSNYLHGLVYLLTQSYPKIMQGLKTQTFANKDKSLFNHKSILTEILLLEDHMYYEMKQFHLI